jgi:group I intron endonuclease
MYTVYKIINTINDKFYIGVHKTTNAYDSYMGSGKLIKAAIAKYGVDNFNKEVLFITHSSEEAYEKERSLLQEVLNTDHCYNLKPGGLGGWHYVHESGLTNKNKTKDHYVKMANRTNELRKADSERYERWYISVSIGITHSDASKEKIGKSISSRRKNTCWITDGFITKEYHKDLILPEGFRYGRTLNKK